MNSDGTGAATQLTPTTGTNGNYDAFAASWSPDGSRVAFVYVPDSNGKSASATKTVSVKKH